MTAEAASLVESWPVGKYRVTLTVPRLARGAVRSAAVEWEPHLPRRLSGSERRAYRRGRDAALARLQQQLGFPLVAVDL